ncbi:uncharacterized protein EV422DRAFT_407821 [Fimicolochytrium jonesii]|uniref:uncharacterized protein n=1 Tax=Fimicolochytrium jonesii TaxID=1396493 RepID=UPI0022FE197C|nr:uncharacterized protein EV422DRAFT_407821 [Fimicolochytrium jonesii]KAI8822630.1 hypothetical protein EV422DRAFT_407821 [Fimicolochytrium jonesii]
MKSDGSSDGCFSSREFSSPHRLATSAGPQALTFRKPILQNHVSRHDSSSTFDGSQLTSPVSPTASLSLETLSTSSSRNSSGSGSGGIKGLFGKFRTLGKKERNLDDLIDQMRLAKDDGPRSPAAERAERRKGLLVGKNEEMMSNLLKELRETGEGEPRRSLDVDEGRVKDVLTPTAEPNVGLPEEFIHDVLNEECYSPTEEILNAELPLTPTATHQIRSPQNQAPAFARCTADDLMNVRSDSVEAAAPITVLTTGCDDMARATAFSPGSGPTPTKVASLPLLEILTSGMLVPCSEGMERLHSMNEPIVVMAAVGGGKQHGSISQILGNMTRVKVPMGSCKRSDDSNSKVLTMMVLDAPLNNVREDALEESEPLLPHYRTKLLLIDAPPFTGRTRSEGTADANEVAWESKVLALLAIVASCLVFVSPDCSGRESMLPFTALAQLPVLLDRSTPLDVLSASLAKIVWIMLDARDSEEHDTRRLAGLLEPSSDIDPTNDATALAQAVLQKVFEDPSLFSVPTSQNFDGPGCDDTPSGSDGKNPVRPPNNLHQQRMDTISETVYKAIGNKCLTSEHGGSLALTGREFVQVLKLCCNMLNDDGGVLDLNIICQELRDDRFADLERDAKQRYTDLMTAISIPHMPCAHSRLRQHHAECTRKTLVALRNIDRHQNRHLYRSKAAQMTAWRQDEARLLRLMGTIDERGKVEPDDAWIVSFVLLNYEKTIARCKRVLAKGQDFITKKIGENKYTSIVQFDEDVNQISANFHRASQQAALLSSIAACSLQYAFASEVAAQRAHLIYRFSERARHAAQLAEREQAMRAEGERREREMVMLRAADALREVQGLMLGVVGVPASPLDNRYPCQHYPHPPPPPLLQLPPRARAVWRTNQMRASQSDNDRNSDRGRASTPTAQPASKPKKRSRSRGQRSDRSGTENAKSGPAGDTSFDRQSCQTSQSDPCTNTRKQRSTSVDRHRYRSPSNHHVQLNAGSFSNPCPYIHPEDTNHPLLYHADAPPVPSIPRNLQYPRLYPHDQVMPSLHQMTRYGHQLYHMPPFAAQGKVPSHEEMRRRTKSGPTVLFQPFGGRRHPQYSNHMGHPTPLPYMAY